MVRNTVLAGLINRCCANAVAAPSWSAPQESEKNGISVGNGSSGNNGIKIDRNELAVSKRCIV